MCYITDLYNVLTKVLYINLTREHGDTEEWRNKKLFQHLNPLYFSAFVFQSHRTKTSYPDKRLEIHGP